MRKNKGLTLIEILTAAAVGGVILSIFSVVLIDSLKMWRVEEKEFSSWQSGERFLRDFRRDLRRSLPGGARNEGDAFVIEFTGDFSGGAEHPALYRARYYVSGKGENRTAVRELFEEGYVSSRRNYAGVVSFSCSRSEEFPSLYKVEVGIKGLEAVLEESIQAPAHGGQR